MWISSASDSICGEELELPGETRPSPAADVHSVSTHRSSAGPRPSVHSGGLELLQTQEFSFSVWTHSDTFILLSPLLRLGAVGNPAILWNVAVSYHPGSGGASHLDATKKTFWKRHKPDQISRIYHGSLEVSELPSLARRPWRSLCR